jgi:DNA-binding transcriptional MerR regulator
VAPTVGVRPVEWEKIVSETPKQGDLQAAGRTYSVTELARELGVTPRTLRFYEDKGLIKPQRISATRVYLPRDRARMILILRGKRLGFSLREISKYLDLYDADPTQRAQLDHLLQLVKDRREQLEQQREAIEETLLELREIEDLALGLPAEPEPPTTKE